VGARSRPSRTAAERPSGRHALRSRAVAAELVRDARIGRGELVVEIGAGDGRLTELLASRARKVVAVELDPRSVERLHASFDGDPRVVVVHEDILDVTFPEGPFRAFGNIPFGVTNAVLRRLLDDASNVSRLDLIVQLEAAHKRAQVWPSNALNLGRLPWWEQSLVRRIPRSAFAPLPSVDAALLRATRRVPPMLHPNRRPAYVALVRRGFERPTWPVRRALREVVPPLTWKRLARERGLPLGSTPRDLDVWDWVALFERLP
jgi:23S rRNA (adenine-N6)-dimethyltransferase